MRNNDFKWATVLITVLFQSLLIFSVVNASDQDQLWEKAVKIATANNSWVPGYVIHYEEVYSRLGIRQEVTETHSVLQRHDSGDVELTFLKIIQNGRDITEDFVQELGKTLILEESEYRVEHPFHNSPIHNVKYQPTDKNKQINGKKCVLYEFIYSNEKGTWEGSAWLEEESGIPVLVHGELVTVPLDEKWYILSDLKITTEYIINDSGYWYPESAIVDSHIEVDGGFLKTYKGRIKETYKFKDYWEYK